jgi:hypothetical protein
MQILVTTRILARAACSVAIVLASLAGHALAQSTDVAWPSPVRTSEVVGTIAARDLGDARLTDHFYAFTATPGDLTIDIESRNLNGDIDVFTFSGLRPLLKFTLYAGSSGRITKSIYVRVQEDLILRVEGRTPNDDDAVYRIRFAGSFAPITSGPLAEHEDAIQPAHTSIATGTGGRRVSSVGATIEEPRTEVAETPTPEPTPVESPEPKATPTKRTARNTRPRRPAPRRTRPAEPEKAEETATKSEAENKPPAANSEPETTTTAKEGKTAAKGRRPTRRTTARSATSRKAEQPPASQEPEDTGPRLVIETADGTLVDRYMSTVRRVTVENGQVVVVGKEGKIQRIPLSSVVRMTISP